MDEALLDAALKHLGAALTTGAMDSRRYRCELATLLRQHFACSRVSLWQIAGGDGERLIRCLARYEGGDGCSLGGEEIREQQFQAYFSRLVDTGVYVSPDTWNDPVLAPMRELRLVPAGIRAMMDAAFTLNGHTFGAVCCEQLGAPRDWTPAEVRQLKRCAALISLHTARADRGDAAWWDQGPTEAAA